VGLVVPPENPQALAEAIQWLSSHPDETAEFGRNGRRMVETQFDRSIVLRNFAARLERCGTER
jgi:glycosyltransferase involved in cell wall biosynthesis